MKECTPLSRGFVKKSKIQVQLFGRSVFIDSQAIVYPSMTPSKGVRIEEMGVKFGCNGVDNAKLWFDHVCYKLAHNHDFLSFSFDFVAGASSCREPSQQVFRH
jgi:hypothetical protein